MAGGDGSLEILWVELYPPNDQQVLQPTGHEQLAVAQEPEIAGSEKARRESVHSQMNGSEIIVRTGPGPAGDMRPGDADFPHLTRRRDLVSGRRHDPNNAALRRLPAAHHHARLR